MSDLIEIFHAAEYAAIKHRDQRRKDPEATRTFYRGVT
jgi:hypothetical protein